jgi:ubiquinone/menaquinone biosynthesis C-methylase UbiE
MLLSVTLPRLHRILPTGSAAVPGPHGPEDADQHASSEEYAHRFSGPVGSWMLRVQERSLLELLPPDAITVLDVGGGHGQTALPASRAGKAVTVLGSSPSCSERLSEDIRTGVISFKVGNLIEIPFENSSFDCVMSFRLMSHCSKWEKLIEEMCRVAESTVIFDYPSWWSTNFMTPLFFRIKRRIEGNTRRYRIFTTRELDQEFRRCGFMRSSIQKQFLFPMGVHRALRSQHLSQTIEMLASRLGLTRLFGSPVVVRFDRIRSEH